VKRTKRHAARGQIDLTDVSARPDDPVGAGSIFNELRPVRITGIKGIKGQDIRTCKDKRTFNASGYKEYKE
jgi:hypothetical protein